MALYWPDEKVALDIVDDPHRRPFEGDESYTVLRVTCADLCDYESFRKITLKLCDLLGKDVPDSPEWLEANHDLYDLLRQNLLDEMGDMPLPDPFSTTDLSNVQVIASSKEEARLMREAARRNGQYVRGISVWEGPVPEGSFEIVSGNMRMSTPEYFFLRKANELPYAEAVSLGLELCGKYRSVLTQYDKGDDYDFIRIPRTSKARIRNYLRGARKTKEGKRAKRVLRMVQDECCSPMSSYLYLQFCLPAAEGGYGFERALPSAAFASEMGFMPASSGIYLAYDVCWPHKKVAVQYTGTRPATDLQMEALQTQGMRVMCITDNDLAHPALFDRCARRVADLLGTTAPEESGRWIESRDRLRKTLKVPAFGSMCLTMDDISEHEMR